MRKQKTLERELKDILQTVTIMKTENEMLKDENEFLRELLKAKPSSMGD